jgi:hypothetical protein
MSTWPRHPERRGRLLDASLHLLDRTVTDEDGVPVAVVVDVEIDLATSERPILADLDVSSGVFAPLRRGRVPADALHRLPWRSVAELDAAIRLALPRDQVGTTGLEQRLRDKIIRRIPGGSHAPE